MGIFIGLPKFQYWTRAMGRSYVQLHFLKDNRVINLYSGSHPLLELQKSTVSFDLHYDAGRTDSIEQLLSRTIESAVDKLLQSSHLTVTQGRDAATSGFCHIVVHGTRKIPGLVIVPEIVVAKEWFK